MTLILVMLSAVLILCGQLYAENPDRELSSTASSFQEESSNRVAYVLNQMVVKFTADTVTTWDFADRIGGTIIDYLDNSDVYLIEINHETNTLSLSEDLDTMEIVDYAHPNYLINSVHPVQGSYPFSDDAKIGNYEYQPPAQTLQLSAAHLLATGSGVTVAVIDGGVDYNHPVLADKAVSAYDFVDNDDDAFDEPGGFNSGHGTFVAGVIHLIAPAAEIKTYRITDPFGIGDGFSLAKAIEQAVNDGSQIINLSVVLMHEHLAVRDAIDYASANNVMVIAAAGNNSSETPIYPAANNNALSVAAVNFDNELADFSNYGDYIDVCAPGYYIYSAYTEGNYAWWSGTSFATPFVAGQAALIKEKLPAATPFELKNLIKNTADNIDDLNPNYTGKLGSGLIDPFHTLELIEDSAFAFVTPDTLRLVYYEGTMPILPPTGFVVLTSSNAPAGYSAQVIDTDSIFVFPRDSIFGFTNDTIAISAEPYSYIQGVYYNTYRFYVSGVSNPVDLVVELAVDPDPGETAEVTPNHLEFTAPLGSEELLTNSVFLNSSNSPAAFVPYTLPGGSQMSYPGDTVGTTPDSVMIISNPSLATAPGHYHDTIAFAVEGVPEPVYLIVDLFVEDTVSGSDTAWSYPYAQGYTAPYGEDTVFSGMVFIGSTNAPAQYTVAYDDFPDIVQLTDTIGYTNDSLLFNVVSTSTMAPGVYVDTLLFFVEGVANNPKKALVYLYIDTLQGSDTAWVYPYAQGYTSPVGENQTQTGVVYIGSSNEPAAYTVEVIDEPDFIQLHGSTGMTGDSMFFDVVATSSMPAGVYIDTLSFFVDGCRNNPYRAIVLLHIQGEQADSAWVIQDSLSSYMTLIENTYSVIYDGFFVNSTNAPANYFVEVIGPTHFTTINDSVGTTNGYVNFTVVGTGLPVGVYYDTLLFHIDGCVNSPVKYVLTLEIVPYQGEDSAWVIQDSLLSYMTLVENTYSVIIDGFFVNSTNAPANYFVEVIGPTHFTTIYDSIGTTNGYVNFAVTGTGLSVGVYTDTLLFHIDGCVNSPVKYVLTLEIVPYQDPVEDSAYIIPDTLYFTIYEGAVPFTPPTDYVNILSTNAPADYTAKVIDTDLIFVIPYDTVYGTTNDSLAVSVYNCTMPACQYNLPAGVYYNHMMINVDGFETLMLVIRLTVEEEPGAVASINPDYLYFTAPLGTEILLFDHAVLMSSNAPALFTAATLPGGSQVSYPFDTVGTTNDSVTIAVNPALAPSVGRYHDTIAYYIEGVIEPVYLLVDLEITGEPADTCIVFPLTGFEYTVATGSAATFSDCFTVLSSNAPASYYVQFADDPIFTTLSDTAGTTDDSLCFEVNSAGLPFGTYVDTLLFYVEGVTNNPEKRTITLHVFNDTAWVSPAYHYFIAPQGEDNAQPGSIFIGSTNAPSPFTVGVLDHPDFIFNLYGSGVTNDSAYFEVTSTASMAPGLYADTLLINVEGVDNSPLISIVYLIIDTVGMDPDSAKVTPNVLTYQVPYGSPDTIVTSVFLSSTNAPARYICEIVGGPSEFLTMLDSLGYTDDSVTVVIDPAGLQPGVNTASVRFLVGGVPDPVYLSVIVSVTEQSTAATLSNYPNPFNPQTNIEYSLAWASHVRLEIYNIIGQQVQVLVDEYKDAGTHTVIWEGKDSRGQSVSSGIYFYRLQTDDMALTRKMILLK
ncbi:MAG: S8 family peptidase [candidate division Zixibacteria bacterium]|nr:S8 family peptidase [candidate division Zixibacteria bacterium]